MESAVETTGLTKIYGSLLAVDHISFEVRQGEVFGFLGPNGAGKTTTIRMLTGLTHPTAGQVHILGGGPTVRLDGGSCIWRQKRLKTATASFSIPAWSLQPG